ncbi:MAG: pyrroline-5-carboxylate reductase [Promethearchaeota archaeon]
MELALGVVGVGNMGGAIVRGVLDRGLSPRVFLYDVDQARCDAFSGDSRVVVCSSLGELASSCRVILLAVKPQVADEVLRELSGHVGAEHTLVSIMAGVSIARVRSSLSPRTAGGAESRGDAGGAGNVGGVVRVMPNAALVVGEGASTLSFEASVDPRVRAFTLRLFSSLGAAFELDERLMDAITGLSGSGPAYALEFLEALADGGVKVGLPKDLSLRLAAQTLLGAVRLYLETGDHPAALRDRVTSPGGTTIAGLHELNKAGFRGAVMDAVEAATRRSRELGG